MKTFVGLVLFLLLFVGCGLLGSAVAHFLSSVDPMWFVGLCGLGVIVLVRLAAKRWL